MKKSLGVESGTGERGFGWRDLLAEGINQSRERAPLQEYSLEDLKADTLSLPGLECAQGGRFDIFFYCKTLPCLPLPSVVTVRRHTRTSQLTHSPRPSTLQAILVFQPFRLVFIFTSRIQTCSQARLANQEFVAFGLLFATDLRIFNTNPPSLQSHFGKGFARCG